MFRSRGARGLADSGDRKACPFIGDPFDDCYCATMSSLNTEATIHYCGGHYGECSIYRARARSRGQMVE